MLRLASGAQTTVGGLFSEHDGSLEGIAGFVFDPAIDLLASVVDGRGRESEPLRFSLKVSAPPLEFDPPVIEWNGAWAQPHGDIVLHGAKGGVPPINYAVVRGNDEAVRGRICASVTITRGVVDVADDTGPVGNVVGSRLLIVNGVSLAGRFLPSCRDSRVAALSRGTQFYTAALIEATDSAGQTARLYGRFNLFFDPSYYG